MRTGVHVIMNCGPGEGIRWYVEQHVRLREALLSTDSVNQWRTVNNCCSVSWYNPRIALSKTTISSSDADVSWLRAFCRILATYSRLPRLQNILRRTSIHRICRCSASVQDRIYIALEYCMIDPRRVRFIRTTCPSRSPLSMSHDGVRDVLMDPSIHFKCISSLSCLYSSSIVFARLTRKLPLDESKLWFRWRPSRCCLLPVVASVSRSVCVLFRKHNGSSGIDNSASCSQRGDTLAFFLDTAPCHRNRWSNITGRNRTSSPLTSALDVLRVEINVITCHNS